VFLLLENESKVSVEFVLNVLRQHEIEIDRTNADLRLLVDSIEELIVKLQSVVDNFGRVQSGQRMIRVTARETNNK
jgi:hypothetical protein